MIDPALAYCLGFASAVVFIAAAELGAQVIERIRARRILRQVNEANKAAAYAEACPWPLRHEELVRRGDWITASHSHHSKPVTEREQRNHV